MSSKPPRYVGRGQLHGIHSTSWSKIAEILLIGRLFTISSSLNYYVEFRKKLLLFSSYENTVKSSCLHLVLWHRKSVRETVQQLYHEKQETHSDKVYFRPVELLKN